MRLSIQIEKEVDALPGSEAKVMNMAHTTAVGVTSHVNTTAAGQCHLDAREVDALPRPEAPVVVTHTTAVGATHTYDSSRGYTYIRQL